MVSLFTERFGLAMRGNKMRCLGLLVLLALFSSLAFAQEATIVGSITDPTGAAVPNAAISITNTETGLTRQFTSNDVGQFVAPGLRFGHYNVIIEAKGFKKVEQKDVVVAIGDRRALDIKLEVGGSTQVVTVEVAPVAIRTETSESSSVVTDYQVANIPANGRSIYAMVTLVPGASANMADAQTPTPAGGDANVSFNGQRMSHNIYLIDGGENLDRGGAGGISVMPSVDAIQELRVMTSNYGADFGLSSAGTTTMAIKSGSKRFHAGGWEFMRNQAFDAYPMVKNYAHPVKPENRLNVYGFNVGGPVEFTSKDPKTFFFYNMEWRKAIQGGNYNPIVPLTPTYGGNFLGNEPADLTLNDHTTIVPHSGFHVPCAYQLSPAQQGILTGAGLTLSTPGSDGTCSVQGALGLASQPTFSPFPTSAIPSGILSGNAQALLAAGIFPAANNGNRFVGGNKSPTNVREEIVRIDHRFNDKFSIFGHWIQEAVMQTFGTTMWSGDNVPTIGNTFGNPSYSGVVHATYIISPTVLNEVSFNYNGNRIHILPKGVINAPGFEFNRVFTGPNELDRVPSIQLAGTTQTNYTSNWVPWNNKADDYQIRDDVSWTKGSHQLKIGGSWSLYKKLQDVFASTQGGFQFNGLYTGNDFADFLLGYSNNYNEAGVKDSGKWNNVSWAAFIQDNWRVNNRLTLNLGLRWDGVPHTYEAANRMSNFYPSMYNPALAAVLTSGGNAIDPSSPGLGSSPNAILAGIPFYLNGIGISGQPGVPRGMTRDQWKAFGPRVGFAYDLSGAGKTVIRGGIGVMYERMQGNDMYNGGTNAPFSANVSYGNVLLDNPKTSINGATLTNPIPVVSMTGISLDDYKLPTSTQYSLGVEQAMGKSILNVSYVGAQTRHQNYYQDINVPVNPDAALLASMAQGTTKLNNVVPYRGFNSLRMSTNGESGHYNSLQASLRGNFKSDLDYQVAYTLSKAVDPATGSGNLGDMNNLSNPYSPAYDVGPSGLDRTHVFVANYVYRIPFLKNSSNHFAKTMLGGWAVSGVVVAQTGFPLNVTLGGQYGSNGLPNSTNRPDLTGKISYPHTRAAWFDNTAFTAPVAGEWGNLSAHSVRAPGRHNWNMALVKQFVFSQERGSNLEFRSEFFNFWNHTQFQNISSSLANGDFGQVTSAYNPRQIQLGLRLTF